jgi:hypothetical protein
MTLCRPQGLQFEVAGTQQTHPIFSGLQALSQSLAPLDEAQAGALLDKVVESLSQWVLIVISFLGPQRI